MSPEVQVAIVSAVGGTTVAAMTGIFAVITKRNTRQLNEKVGNPNGYGNLSAMLELVIDNVKYLHVRMDSLEQEKRVQAVAHKDMARSIKSIEERLDAQSAS